MKNVTNLTYLLRVHAKEPSKAGQFDAMLARVFPSLNHSPCYIV